jgi:hypothetical protein
MQKVYTGGCQCGAIRFRTDDLVDNAHICHCRMCQKAMGNFFAALVSSGKDRLQWTRGMPARFQSSDGVERGFCAQCGTPLFYDPLHSEDVSLCIGAFDNAADIKPVSQDSIESRVPWFADIAAIHEAGTSIEIDGPEKVAKVAASNRQHPDHETEVWPPKSV